MKRGLEYFTLQVGMEIFDQLNRRDLLAIIHVCTGALDMAIEGGHMDGSGSRVDRPGGAIECDFYHAPLRLKRKKGKR